MKGLLQECPQDFVSLVLAGARYIGRREGQFQTREIRSDGMVEAEYEGRGLLIHVEFQSEKDAEMDERLLGYSYEAIREHKLPVLSCVIYLQKVSNVPQPPLCWDLPNGRRVLWFDYLSIELAEWPVEDLKRTNLDVVLPLLVLSKGGARREVLNEVVTRLEAEKKSELLANTRLFAELVFKSHEDQVWLNRRFAMIDDYMYENSPTYRGLIDRGREQGLEAGREEGLQEGVRQNLEAVVRQRFPALLPLVQERAGHLSEYAQLQEFLLKASTARTAREFKEYLLNLLPEETGKPLAP